MTHLAKCPESGRATGLLDKPRYRRHCFVCGRLVKVVYADGHFVVGMHYRVKPKAAQGYTSECVTCGHLRCDGLICLDCNEQRAEPRRDRLDR